MAMTYHNCHHFFPSIALASSSAIAAKFSAPFCISSVRLSRTWCLKNIIIWPTKTVISKPNNHKLSISNQQSVVVKTEESWIVHFNIKKSFTTKGFHQLPQAFPVFLAAYLLPFQLYSLHPGNQKRNTRLTLCRYTHLEFYIFYRDNPRLLQGYFISSWGTFEWL